MNFYNQPHQFYCGIDLHARLLAICILDHAGNIVCQTSIEADKQTSLSLIGRRRGLRSLANRPSLRANLKAALLSS
jgi:hypothetical protein